MNDPTGILPFDITPYLPFIAMPFIVAFVGWITNWFGIKMMFHPAEFKGIGFIGWQGIVPRIRARMTRDIIRQAVSNVCKPADMIEALNEADVINELSHMMEPIIEDIVDEFMVENGAKYWDMALIQVRRPVYNKVKQQLPIIAKGLMEDVKERADYLLDIEDLAVQSAVEKPGILTDLVTSMFQREFQFIIFSGLYIGFPLGCIQAVLWYFFPVNWLLPVFGAFVGGVTNWLALQVLAYPAEPRKFLGFTMQGVLIKRQAYVADAFSDQFTTSFLGADDMIDYIWNGEHGDEVRHLVKRRLRRAMDGSVITKAFDNALRLASKGEAYDDKAIRLATGNLVNLLERDEVTTTLMTPIQELLKSRMKAMTPTQFSGLFLPLFEQDKWLMIIVGAALGAGVGFVQLVYLFGGQLAGG
jgi:uncharacterized membrane protein YheB (UPF0754 family)